MQKIQSGQVYFKLSLASCTKKSDLRLVRECNYAHSARRRKQNYVYICFRSSHPEVVLRKGVLQICSNFTGVHPCRSAISIKLQSIASASIEWNSSNQREMLHYVCWLSLMYLIFCWLLSFKMHLFVYRLYENENDIFMSKLIKVEADYCQKLFVLSMGIPILI